MWGKKQCSYWKLSLYFTFVTKVFSFVDRCTFQIYITKSMFFVLLCLKAMKNKNHWICFFLHSLWSSSNQSKLSRDLSSHLLSKALEFWICVQWINYIELFEINIQVEAYEMDFTETQTKWPDYGSYIPSQTIFEIFYQLPTTFRCFLDESWLNCKKIRIE